MLQFWPQMWKFHLSFFIIPINTRRGKNGHIGLIMRTTLYSTLSTVGYVTPRDPGLTPTYGMGTITLAACQTTEDNHKIRRFTFNQHNNVNNSLKELIIDAVNILYLQR